MMITQRLLQQIQQFFKLHHLMKSSKPLIVGVSGGTDSVCLLHCLASLRDRLGLNLHVVHLNHQLRGAESDADAQYVLNLSKKLGLPATIESRDVGEYQAHHRCSLEEAAREVRYGFFSEITESIGAQAVAVAHTANDQAETILIHLIRGTGLAGLRGMSPVTRWSMPDGKTMTIIRPLLENTRQETSSYCETMGLNPRRDSSNESREHLRNRIRAEVMPLLREYNPNIVETLSRTAHIIRDDLIYLDMESERALKAIVEEFPHGLLINNKPFLALSPALQRRLLRLALRRLVGGLRDIESIHIETVREAMSQPAGKQLSLPYGLVFYGDYEKSAIASGENPLAILTDIEGEHCLTVPGETAIPGWKIVAEIVNGGGEAVTENGFTACFDLEATGQELKVRTRRDGDRFQPLGMTGSKKLQDFMVDSKIPRAWRDRVPLVCSGDRIIWIVGWRIDHRFRVTDSTRRMLWLRFEME